jgi:hypothetical protein
MPQKGFESTIPVFERMMTVHVLDGAATLTGSEQITKTKLKKSVAFSPQANYTNRATAACRRS